MTKIHWDVKKSPFDTAFRRKYNKYCNLVTFEINKAKKDYFTQRYEQCKENQNEKWKFINELISKKKPSTLPAVLNVDGQEISEPTEICNTFNNYFTDIGKNLTNHLQGISDFIKYFPSPVSVPYFRFHEIDSGEVFKIIEI